MKFLIDNAVSPVVCGGLRRAGFDAVHVRDYRLQDAPDVVIFDRAVDEARIIVSADTDFGFLLAHRHTEVPSLILFRGEFSRNPSVQADILTRNLGLLEDALDKGSVIIFDGKRIRIRSLPL